MSELLGKVDKAIVEAYSGLTPEEQAIYDRWKEHWRELEARLDPVDLESVPLSEFNAVPGALEIIGKMDGIAREYLRSIPV